jgi:2-iminobutanoate/2-iminopropanoate deaminase
VNRDQIAQQSAGFNLGPECNLYRRFMDKYSFTALSYETDVDLMLVAVVREEEGAIVMKRLRLFFVSLLALSALLVPVAARQYLPLPAEIATRSYSPAVVTKGGKTVWLAGVTTLKDEQGKSLAGDVEGQTRFIFREIARNLEKLGGKLEDVVTMTVFLTDARNGAEFAKVRKEVFPKNAPASAQVTVAALAVPGFLVEVQCVAVIGDEP